MSDQRSLTDIRKQTYDHIGALVAELTVFVCFLESYQRIQNPHLKSSLTVFLIFSLLVNVCFLAASLLVLNGSTGWVPFVVAASISWVVAWLSVTYYTTYRATTISFIGYRRPWIASLVAIVCQGALSVAALIFFNMNYVRGFGAGVDPRYLTITVVESFYYSIVETLLFIVTQYRIVALRARTNRVSTRTKVSLYLRAATRSLLYSVTVVMMFVSVGGGFALSWTVYGLSLILLILMTDIYRFQETIALLTDGKAAKHIGTIDMTERARSSANQSGTDDISFSMHVIGNSMDEYSPDRVGRI